MDRVSFSWYDMTQTICAISKASNPHDNQMLPSKDRWIVVYRNKIPNQSLSNKGHIAHLSHMGHEFDPFLLA
jgi:hypothetical protein